MTTNIREKFGREVGSFYSLSMVNIVFSAVSMALGISFGVQNVLILKEAMSLLLPQLAFTVIGFLVFGVSLRWLISSVEILDGVSEIKDDYDKKKAELNDEATTGLIVKMMAYYRDNKNMIHGLSLLSRIAGICFIASGIINIINNVMVGTAIFNVLTVIGIILYLAVGVAGIIIPHFFSNYSSVWDYRLQQSVNAENELDKALEGS